MYYLVRIIGKASGLHSIVMDAIYVSDDAITTTLNEKRKDFLTKFLARIPEGSELHKFTFRIHRFLLSRANFIITQNENGTK